MSEKDIDSLIKIVSWFWIMLVNHEILLIITDMNIKMMYYRKYMRELKPFQRNTHQGKIYNVHCITTVEFVHQYSMLN